MVKSTSSPFQLASSFLIRLDECQPVIISSSLFHHVLHHCSYVFHCSTVYWSPIGRPLIAWRLSRKKQEKSKQRNSFVNSLLLLAADLAQVVMPILLERTQTSYCHPSLAGAPWTQIFVCKFMALHVCVCGCFYVRKCRYTFMYVCVRGTLCLCLPRVLCLVFSHFVITYVPDWWHCHYTRAHIHNRALTYLHGLSVLAFLNEGPSALLKHENEIDSLELKDGTADTRDCCQHPWRVSTDNGSGQPNCTVATSFLSNVLTNICTPVGVHVHVGYDNISDVCYSC